MKTVINRRQSEVQIETTIQTKEGSVIPVKMNTAGLFDKDGNLIGGIEAFQDISALKSLEREKANLASMFAHDMNSSLTGIHGLALRLSKTDDLNEEMPRKYIEVIEKEAAKLESLVRDFLEFTRLQTGQLHLSFSSISLDKELWELFDLYQPKASQRGITLEFHTAGTLPIIEADVDRLRRVFTNLLDNALKFSKEKGKINIKVEEAEQEVKVQIGDDGIGISPEDLPYIFDLFYRGRGAASQKGSGVGLGTVKAIVEGHRGRIFVASELGKGTVFTVLLPKVRQLDAE
jgi:two-component system, OmpR family, phosphate regulon sensor histidine kinase PhoR